MSAPQESTPTPTPTVAENNAALLGVTFAEFYSSDLRDMLEYVGLLARYAGSRLASEIPLAQAAQPTTAAASQAFLVAGHFNREIDDHLSQPPRVFSPLAALGLSFTKAIFSPMKKRLKVAAYFQLGMAVAASGGDQYEDPFNPDSRERNRLSVMLIIYMILGRRTFLPMPEPVATLLAQLPPLSAATHGIWWDAGNEILRLCDVALARLNLHSYRAAENTHPVSPGPQFRYTQKPSFLKNIAIFSGDSILSSLASGGPGNLDFARYVLAQPPATA